MQLSICSWSFVKALRAGQQDMFKYITDCKELGATQLDPWNGHLAQITASVDALKASNPDPAKVKLSKDDKAYLKKVKAAADAAGLPFGCIAVDGAHMWEPNEPALRANRAARYYWLQAVKALGAPQIRLDTGGEPQMTEEMFQTIVREYQDVVAKAKAVGIEVVMENHWGVCKQPENMLRILPAVPGLGLLFDNCNFPQEVREKCWDTFAPMARACHIKTFAFDAEGNESTVDVPKSIRTLIKAGYKGCWGVESCPKDGDEYGGVRKTFALIRRVVGE